MAKKKQIIIRPDQNVIEVEGKKYRQKKTKYKMVDGVEHIDKIILEEVDEKDQLEKIGFITSKLADKIPPHRIVEEIIKALPTNQLNRIFKILKKGAKIKRQDGCLGLKIDGEKYNTAYINIFD